MAEDITFVHFRYGTYAEINNSAKNSTLNPHAVYIATDKQLMYAKGAWIGVTSVTSEVNQATGEIKLKFNYDSEGQPTGNPITCTISGAGMTTQQKTQLATAYSFVTDIAGTSPDSIINKWQEVVNFLEGFKDTDILLDRIVEIETDVKSITDLVNDMFSLVNADGTTYIKTKYGFASEKFVSAGGTDDTESGGAGGANLTQMWESLQNNNDTFKDRLINIAHIPTLTTGKISDFVSATQAIANTAVANKADKDKVVDLTSAQTITGGKTFNNLKVSNATLVTNLNADMLDGLHGSAFAKNLLNTTINIDENIEGLYGGKLNGANGTFPDNVNYVNNGAYLAFGQRGYEVNIASRYNVIYLRTKEDGTISKWKQLAFTNDVLPLTGGTLTGALTVNAPINNTGALKLLGASEVSSTGMAVHEGATAVGTHANALGKFAYAGVKSPDGTSNVELYGYESLPVTIDGNTVYGFELTAKEEKSFIFSGTEYTISNPNNTQLASVFLIPIDSTFAATALGPYNRCSVIKSNGISRGRNPEIIKVQHISDSVVALCIYNSVTKTSSDDFSGAYTIYALRTSTASTYTGNYAFASGYNSLATGNHSLSMGYQSLATGQQSIAMGVYSTATNNRAVAIGQFSVALGASSIALGDNSVAKKENSRAFGYGTIACKNYQTVIGYLNEEDTTNIFVIGAGSTEKSRKNVFTVDANGYVRMGNRLHIGVGGKNEVYLVSDVEDQLYVHTSAGVPLVIQGHTVRRGSSAANATLGTNSEKWANVYTEALKIADANLTYNTGTLTIDKALKTTSTLTATQGEFANYVKIGNATISWNPNGYLEINEGLASHKFISAGGVVTGNAGGGAGGLSLTDMWVSLNGNIDAYGKSKIHIDHIPLDVILSHDDYENDVANRINTFNYSNSTSFTSAVKALIVADNIPTLEMSKINGLENTFTNISTVVQSNYETLSNLITNNHNDHEARIKAIERALTWQTI